MDYPDSMGSLAYSESQHNAARIVHLERRVETLELEVERILEWSEELANQLNVALDSLAAYVGYHLEIPESKEQ